MTPPNSWAVNQARLHLVLTQRVGGVHKGQMCAEAGG